MKDKKYNDAVFTNEDTRVRRAWIESALAGVRSRLGNDTELAENVPGTDDTADAPDLTAEMPARSSHQANGQGKGRLYVAWSARERRSGT